MQTIQLARGTWNYDSEKQLGQKGGFGSVYEGYSSEHGPIAVKVIHAERLDFAHRELRFADDFLGSSLSNVLPVLDAGLDAATGSYCIVMPRAERSLSDLIESTGQLDECEAVPILRDIALGLHELPNVVHRDLKPANVLFHEGQWKLADFGIAKLMDETTSDRTLRGFRAPPYAAPEQWKEEKVTKAIDVYALGCIAYTLLLGRPPFAGPDFRDKHCTEQPPPLRRASHALQSLVQTMLYKQPAARPGVDRVIQRLDSIRETGASTSRPLSDLGRIGVRDAEERARRDAMAATAREIGDSRSDLAAIGLEQLQALSDRLFSEIEREASSAIRSMKDDSVLIRLRKGTLRIDPFGATGIIRRNVFEDLGWDFVRIAGIKVLQLESTYEWGSSLWFGRLSASSECRWYETSYFQSPLVGSRSRQPEPFFLTAEEAVKAHRPGHEVYCVAFGPAPVDAEDYPQFRDRWVERFARAAEGNLHAPRTLPLPPA